MQSYCLSSNGISRNCSRNQGVLGPGFDSISPHVSKINIIKTKGNPKLQENRERIVGNNILSEY